jgi:hypothetical protein
MIKAMKMAGIKQVINKYIEGIGQVRDIDIDRTGKRIELILELEGEDVFVKVIADGYQLEREGLTFHSFKCDKTWIETVLNKFLAGRTIDVPEGLAYTAIKAVL